MLVLTRRAGEAFFIGDSVCVTVEEIKGDKIKISISAPKDIPILRKELREAQNANIEALSSDVSGIKTLNSNLHKRQKD